MEVLIQRKNVVLDSQLLTTLMACPCLADYRFNHNLVSINGKSNSIECGSIVHKVFEYYNKSLIKGFKRDLAIQNGLTAGELYIRGCSLCFNHNSDNNTPCGHQPDEFPGLKNTPADSTSKPSRTGWKYVLKTCEEYFDRWKNDSWIPLECEVTKAEILYEDEEIRIMWKAKLDRIVDTNQGIYPVDTKTMKQNRDTTSLNNQFIGQCHLTKTRTVWIDKVGFQTSLKPEEKFKRVPINYSADRLIEWQSVTLPYYAKLLLMYNESGYWPQNLTHCENKYGICQFRGVCEADRGMREEEIKQNFTAGRPWDIQLIED